MSKLVWNGDWSKRMEDSNPTECHFQFFCKNCDMDVTMEDGRMFEGEEDIRYKLKCPICHKWTWV